jgi:hypothetical protein
MLAVFLFRLVDLALIAFEPRSKSKLMRPIAFLNNPLLQKRNIDESRKLWRRIPGYPAIACIGQKSLRICERCRLKAARKIIGRVPIWTKPRITPFAVKRIDLRYFACVGIAMFANKRSSFGRPNCKTLGARV